MPEVGELAPDFALFDQEGKVHRLSDYRGQYVVLFFYPKAMTPGCTREVRAFTELYPEFAARGVAVLGVSADPASVQKKFAEKLGVPFPLLSDPDYEVIRAYGAYGVKNLYGKKSEGTLRHTYLIDPEGKVVFRIKRAKPEEHPRKVLEALGG